MKSRFIDLDEIDSCLRRSIFTGLRYIGVTDDDCSWVPINPTTEVAEEVLIRLTRKYPKLKLMNQNRQHEVNGNYPILLVYGTGKPNEIGGEVGHAVFCSDNRPLPKSAWFGVKGWENYI